MKFKIGICDDEKLQLESIKRLVEKWSASSRHVSDIRCFPSAEAFLFEYEEERDYDILLLDVEMRGITGIDLAKQIRREDSRAEIVFITSHFEFAGEGYEVDALHYLIKPVAEEKLKEVLSRAVERLAVELPSLVVTSDGETVKLYEKDILYVEAFLHYVVIHTENREYRMKESFSAFEAKLSKDFFRTHRSYLVSLKHVMRISRTRVRLDDETEIPLARGKYDAINSAFIERN